MVLRNFQEDPNDFGAYLEQQIEDGYLDTDCEPIKCIFCESTDLENDNHIMEEHMVVEFDKVCNNCGEVLGNWAYGMWSY